MARSIAARSRVAVLITTTLLAAAGAPIAHAAPSDQRVRIEGKDTTLYEGTIRTDGHAIRASSDTEPRICDGTNNGAHATPGPTPTAASDDAMRSIGQDFDGQWYPGFDDYFIQRFGPDGEDASTYAYWGILVNGIYTSVGGCQYGLAPGDQTLWVYDAFNNRDLLRLDGPEGVGEPTSDAEGAPPTAAAKSTFTVGLGQPFVVSTVRNEATGDIGAAGYRRPAVGVRVSPVITAANGAQTVASTDPATVVSDAAGRATLSWTTPGWKRIKAEGTGFVRSNRLDICVTDAAGGGCGATPPADTATRVPPPSTVPAPAPTPAGSGALTVGAPAPSGRGFRVGGLTVQDLRVTTDGNPSALVGVRWTVLGGSPTKDWRIEYRVPGVKQARWRTAKRGTVQTSALLDVPAGRTVDLRARFAAPTGRAVVRQIGRVVVPIDERVRQVRFSGRITRQADPLAWRKTVTRMRRGTSLRVTLPAGRPALVVRADRRRAVIEVRSGRGRAQRVTVPAHADGRTVVVRARERRRGSAVRIRVLSGVVRADGLAVGP
ncbi:hypothetical protein [Patulibacter sp.]|uniref:hypothetical protein n=1 Tax=Patulibacter sp. TaxID=1912859 RepID=UPI002724111F|nr:hypothetical protein [Patulibacter sp.]MDO9409037.1 hypothetical protein [Patulibacter sp.]